MASAPSALPSGLSLRVGVRRGDATEPEGSRPAPAASRVGENVVFFGNNLGVECQRCGAYNQTSLGHKFCAHVSCPIALREFKRRRRKRTSSLEKVYLPRLAEARSAALDGSPQGQDDVEDAVAEGGERSVFVDGGG